MERNKTEMLDRACQHGKILTGEEMSIQRELHDGPCCFCEKPIAIGDAISPVYGAGTKWSHWQCGKDYWSEEAQRERSFIQDQLHEQLDWVSIANMQEANAYGELGEGFIRAFEEEWSQAIAYDIDKDWEQYLKLRSERIERQVRHDPLFGLMDEIRSNKENKCFNIVNKAVPRGWTFKATATALGISLAKFNRWRVGKGRHHPSPIELCGMISAAHKRIALCNLDWEKHNALLKARQRKMAKAERPLQERLQKFKCARYTAAWRNVVPSTWITSGGFSVRFITDEQQCGMSYVWEWNERSSYQARHGYSNGGSHTLTVSAILGQLPIVKGDSIQVGCWKYQKRRGCALAMTYIPKNDDRDVQFFAAERNQTRRAAMMNACGDRLLGGMKLMAADDYGKLYQEEGNDPAVAHPAQYVRVVCPTTGNVYVLGVQHCKTAKEAVAQTFGLHEEHYNPTLER